jgi:hypothetical protein
VAEVLAGELARRMASMRVYQPVFGTIASVDATAGRAVVALPSGGTLTSLAWLAWYSPVVGDAVVLIRGESGWVIAGDVSADITLPVLSYTTTLVTPVASRAGWQDGAAAGTSWRWYPSAGYEGSTQSAYLLQGMRNAAGDGRAGAAWWPTAAEVIPEGATVTGARIRMTRPDWAWGADLVAPRLYGLSPTMVPADYGVVGPLTTVAGFGPWQPGTLGRSKTGTWELPSSWLSAWLAGTICGVATVASAESQASGWAPTLTTAAPLTVTYTTPA